MNDYKEIWQSFIKSISSHKNLKDLIKKLDSGKATYEEAQKYSSSLANYLVDFLSAENPTNAEQILETLKDRSICKNFFKEIDDYTYSMQKTLNEVNNLGINAVKVTSPRELIDSNVSLSDDYEKDISNLASKVELNANKHVDTVQQANAMFQSDANYSITVSRTYDGKGLSDGRTCKWCMSRVGHNVPYNEAYKRGMFQRHEGCHCIIEYNNNGTKTYQTSKGGRNSWQLAQEQKNNEKLENDIIQKKSEVRPHVKNVAKEYFRESTPGVGTIQAEETYYKKNNHDAEIENSRWILKKFGGNIKLITEPEIRRIADYEWDGAYWELKSPKGSGKRTISNQFNSALKQIELNPGGLILETKDLQMNLSSEQLIEECADEMIKKKFPGDVILKKKDKLIAILHDDYND